MVTDDGRVKVLDFGLATFVGTGSDLEETRLTQDGLIVGTFPYMSPEQVEGKPVDHRSDIFSLGVVMYEAVTGRRPFLGDSGPALMSAILRDAPPQRVRPLRRPARLTGAPHRTVSRLGRNTSPGQPCRPRPQKAQPSNRLPCSRLPT